MKAAIYWLVFAFWLTTALPILAWSVMTLEVPLWPNFSAESTTTGISVWAVIAAWFYVTPVVLWFLRKRMPIGMRRGA